MILSLSPAPERRCACARAATLSDIFEERGYLVLATSNKTHLSVGTANLFGDLAPGLMRLINFS